jgi:Ser/Thr protein kinase RdoA (MazF antagonist)
VGVTELAGALTVLARRVCSEVTQVTDYSWPREGSAVWRIAGPGGCWYLKQHSSALFHQREIAALRCWAQAMGPGRVPVLVADDGELLAMVITALPGQPVSGLGLTGREEREVHRQAGVVLRRLHEAARPASSGAGIHRVTGRVEAHLRGAGCLLTPSEAALVRRCAQRLSRMAPALTAVPVHGDIQPRNWLWDRNAHRLAMIDFERAEAAPAVRDLVRLAYGAWDGRPDLQKAFFTGYGRALTPVEDEALICFAALDALSGLVWGTANDDGEVLARARTTFTSLLPPA